MTEKSYPYGQLSIVHNKAKILNRSYGASKFSLCLSLCWLMLVAVLGILLLISKTQKISASSFSDPPTLTAISPTEAYNWQPTTVTITGTGFFTITGTGSIFPTACLGIVPLTNITFVSSTTLTATVPADLPVGSYTPTVTNPDGQSASLANVFTALPSGDGTLSSWTTTTSMTTKQYSGGAVQANGHLYALGGHTGGSGSEASVERAAINADGSLSSWQAVNSMTTERAGLAAVATGDYLYALGGYGGGPLSSVERAGINSDGSLNAWQATTSMSTPRYYFAAVQVDGYIYALGGFNGNGGMNSVERAVINSDGSLGSWQTVASMTIPRYSLGAVTIGGYLYALGGVSDGGYTSSVERAVINPDGSLGPWEVVSSMAIPRCGVAAVAAGGYIYVLGGHTVTGAVSSVERTMISANGSLGSWQATSSMTTVRGGLGAVAVKGYLYAVGGQSSGYLSSVERAAINFDITAPTADSLSINGGALNSTSTNVTVTVSASDSDSGVADMSCSNDGTTWSNWRDYSTHVSWSLSTGDSSKTVYCRVRDSAGHVSSVVSDTISLDTTAPTEYGLSINDGALFTNKVTVTLTIGAQPGTAQMQVSNDGGFAGAEWEPYASRKSWQITQYGDYVIPRVVYVRYKDVSGNMSATYQDDIILDVNAPTGSVQVVGGVSGNSPHAAGTEAATMYSVGINAADDYTYAVHLPLVLNDFCTLPTGPANITLHLQAEDDLSGVADMMISHLPDCRCGTWEPYSTTKAWYAPGAATTIYVKFRDNAGNVSEVVTDAIPMSVQWFPSPAP